MEKEVTRDPWIEVETGVPVLLGGLIAASLSMALWAVVLLGWTIVH